jgi:acyl-CoA hydrolase
VELLIIHYTFIKNMQGKSPKDSLVTMTEIVLPNDTNVLGNLRGGKILHWMDIASAISAGKHSNAVVVTASVDNVSFENPIKLGDVVTITSRVTRVFNTSMETHLEVWAENLPTQTRYKCNEAYYTFVALDSNGRPKKSLPLIPETEDEQKHFIGALRRRELRLVLAGRLKSSDAKELKSFFE